MLISKDLSWVFPPSMSLANLGIFGDSFNVLTSLFTGLAFAGVIISVILQTQELKEARNVFAGQKKALEEQQEEMVNQSFDNKFFQMLNLLNSIKYSFATKGEHGHKILKRLRVILISESESATTLDSFQESFIRFNNIHDITFKYFFINLYQVLKYIDKEIEDIEVAKDYTNIVRAQLSKDELVLLFFNAYCIIDISGNKYKKLVEKYSFFEHLEYADLADDNNRIIIDSILIKYDVNVFGNNKSIKDRIEEIKLTL